MRADDEKCFDQGQEGRPGYGPSDEGHTEVANIMSWAARLAALANATQAVAIAIKEYELGDKYYRISNDWLKYYRTKFAPIEEIELDETFKLKDAEPEYEVARGRARAVAWLAFKGKLGEITRCLSRYCTGLRQDMVLELSAGVADAVAMADGLGYRNERAYIESYNDRNYQKTMNTIRRGRNFPGQSVSLAKNTTGIYGDLWDQAWAGLNNAGMYLGYMSVRNATRYPTTLLTDASSAIKYQTVGQPTSHEAALRSSAMTSRRVENMGSSWDIALQALTEHPVAH